METAPDSPPAPGTRIVTGLLMAIATVSAWHPISSVDLFFHMTLGRAVLREGARTVPEPAAFLSLAAPRPVPQWLWDVTAFRLYETGGLVLLGVLTLAVAAASAWAVCRLAARSNAGGSLAVLFTTAGLGVVATMTRTGVRPQALFMLLLPCFVLLVWRYVDASGRARGLLGAAVVAFVAFWTQVHGSFVLAPAIWLALVVPPALQERERAHLATDAAVLAGTLLALCTGAFGAGFVPYVFAHGASDAVRYIAEMQAPSGSELASSWLPVVPWLLALPGITARGRVRWQELGLAVIGVAIAFNATRFFAAATILATPLATLGAGRIEAWMRSRGPGWRVGTRLAPAILVLPAIAGWLRFSSESHGPVFQLGLAEGRHPVLAAAWLARVPRGANVLADYASSASLGFWADGRYRTFVDGRTPLHFDDTDFAVQREIFRHPAALARAIRRHHPAAAVVRRDRPVCPMLASIWTPVVVEARFTTFAPPGSAEPLAGLEPCGPEYLAPDACAGSAAGLDRSLARLEALAPAALTRTLRAERTLRCGGNPGDALAILPSARESFAFRDAWRRAKIRALFETGQSDAALVLLWEAIHGAGDLAALGTLRGFAPTISQHAFRTLLEATAEAMRDRAPPGLRADLARVCASEGDAECARFHGFRAAVRGEARARPALEWLARHHPDERARRDAAAWLQWLEEDAAPVR